jgi:hypothetical protein
MFVEFVTLTVSALFGCFCGYLFGYSSVHLFFCENRYDDGMMEIAFNKS